MKNITYSLIFLSLIALSACNTEDYFNPIIEIELPKQTPKLVVYSEMWEGQKDLSVFVTQNRNTLDNKPFPVKVDSAYYLRNQKDTVWYSFNIESADIVENVKVELFKNDVIFATFAKTQKTGFYTFKLNTPLKYDGANYRLRVSAPNFETVEATQKMPSPVSIDTLTFRPNARIADPSSPFEYSTRNEFGIEFKDPADEKNYYTANAYTIYKNNVNDSFPYPLYFYSLDPISYNNYLTDASFNGKKALWREHTFPNSYAPNTKITVGLLSLSEAYFTYQQSISLYRNNQDNPFAEPVVLYTNIKNGYGLFAMGAIRTYNFTVK